MSSLSSETIASIAIVGIGSIGLRHANNLRQLRPGARLIAVSGSLAARGGLVSFPVFDAHYKSLDVAIDAEDLSAVILCNAAPLHIPALTLCLDANLPVLIEKPLAHALSAISHLSSLKLDDFPLINVGYHLRYSHGLQKIKQLLLSGQLGRVTSVRAEVGQYLPDWRKNVDYRETVTAKRNKGGGVLLELSHELDYLQFLFGNPVSVQAQLIVSGLLDMDAEDQADLLCCYRSSFAADNLFTCHIHLDCLQRKSYRRLRIVGSLGSLEWDVIASTVSVFIVDDIPQCSYWQFPEDSANWLYLSELEAFLLAASDQEKSDAFATSFSESKQTLAVIDAARKASTSGQRQVINYTGNCQPGTDLL